MDDKNYLTYPLPEGAATFLRMSVELAKKAGVLTVTYNKIIADATTGEAPDYHLQAWPGSSARLIALRGRPIKCLELLGYAERFEHNVLFLTGRAFDWERYQQKTRLGKWFDRMALRTRDVVFGATTALTLVLTVWRLIDLAK